MAGRRLHRGRRAAVWGRGTEGRWDRGRRIIGCCTSLTYPSASAGTRCRRDLRAREAALGLHRDLPGRRGRLATCCRTRSQRRPFDLVGAMIPDGHDVRADHREVGDMHGARLHRDRRARGVGHLPGSPSSQSLGRGAEAGGSLGPARSLWRPSSPTSSSPCPTRLAERRDVDHFEPAAPRARGEVGSRAVPSPPLRTRRRRGLTHRPGRAPFSRGGTRAGVFGAIYVYIQTG
jgi:hypothetical protein